MRVIYRIEYYRRRRVQHTYVVPTTQQVADFLARWYGDRPKCAKRRWMEVAYGLVPEDLTTEDVCGIVNGRWYWSPIFSAYYLYEEPAFTVGIPPEDFPDKDMTDMLRQIEESRHAGAADVIAAENIAALGRAVVNQPYVSGAQDSLLCA